MSDHDHAVLAVRGDAVGYLATGERYRQAIDELIAFAQGKCGEGSERSVISVLLRGELAS